MTYLDQLTKKNKDFINIATKQFLLDGKSDGEVRTILEGILPQILERQAAGESARHFLGAPTAWAASFSQAQVMKTTEHKRNTNPYLMWLDVTLLLLGVMTLINVSLGLFGKDVPPTRLLSLLVLVCLGGLVMCANYYVIYRHRGQASQKGPNLFKHLLVFGGSMGVWVVMSIATAFLPDAINPVLDVPVMLLLSLVAFGARLYLKYKFNIQSAMTPNR